MSNQPRPANRGPAAAATNRAALIDAARTLFAIRGYQVPLSAVAKHAGVGQGVLYRHFPTRLDLALAVFEENFAVLETLATAPDDDAFDRLWARLVDLTLESFGLVELVVDARRQLTAYDGHEHLARLVTPLLARAQSAELVRSDLSVEDVALALRMVYGVAATSPDPRRTEAEVRRVQTLLRELWRP